MKTALEIARAVRDKSTSARETVTDCLSRIAAADPDIHATVSCLTEEALIAADDVDKRLAAGDDPGPMSGVPIAVKDNICTPFGRTTCASKVLQNYASPYAAHVVDRLQASGAIIVAKTNMDEFAMGSSTENSAFFITRNPWNLDRVVGGSSGGSVAAVASRMVPWALGSDTGGSIRQPASFGGVVGLKPTYGRVSRYGLVAFGSSLDQIGTITQDARDAALLLSVIAGRDPRDSTSIDEPVPEYLSQLDDPIKGVKIGVAKEYFGDGLDESVRWAVQAGIDRFRDQGAEVIEISMPHLKYAIACYYVIATAEASSNLARYDGVHFGHRTKEAADIFELYSNTRREALGAEVKRRIMLGTYVLSSGYYDAYYKKALKVRTLIKRDFEEAFQKVDVIASPVAPTTAFAIGEKTDDPLTMYLADIYTTSANLAGLPGISLPCGFDADNLPIGLQLMAPWFGEQRLLSLTHQYQRLTNHHQRTPS